MGYKRRETTEVLGNVTFSRPRKNSMVYKVLGHNRAAHSPTFLGSTENIL